MPPIPIFGAERKPTFEIGCFRFCPNAVIGWGREGLSRFTAGVGATGVVPRTPLKPEPQTSGDPMVSGIAGRHDCVVLRIEEHVVLRAQRHADPGAQHVA
jgi:hypothetical protein